MKLREIIDYPLREIGGTIKIGLLTAVVFFGISGCKTQEKPNERVKEIRKGLYEMQRDSHTFYRSIDSFELNKQMVYGQTIAEYERQYEKNYKKK